MISNKNLPFECCSFFKLGQNYSCHSG